MFLKTRLIAILFSLIAIVYILGAIFIDVMDIDAAQYASISLEMLRNKSFLQVYCREANYLDKPPLLFWLSAFSYKIFGINQFAYRLPTIISSVLGAYATFKLASKLYSKESGILASLILLSCQAYFLHNHDVRTDTLLTNFSIFTIWQLYEYITHNKWKNLFGAFTGMALAMLSKGPIGIMVPILAIGSHLVFKKDWKAFFKWQWIVGIIWTLLLLSPMIWGLYTQFGWDGPYFFFWLQSFGRLTGENSWDNNPDPFFLYHSFLWEFIPWMLIAYFGVFRNIYKAIKSKKYQNKELLTIGGFTLSFIALSRSNFQLPHYILVVFPLVSIITANTILDINNGLLGKKAINIFSGLQWIILILLIVMGTFVMVYVFPGANIFLWLCFITGIIFTMFQIFKGKSFLEKAIVPSVIMVITLNLILNLYFYPNLTHYQVGRQIANYIDQNDIPKSKVYFIGKCLDYSTDFYSNNNFINLKTQEALDSLLIEENEMWLLVSQAGMKKLDLDRLPISKKETFEQFRITTLTPKFLNPETREEALKPFLILHLKE